MGGRNAIAFDGVKTNHFTHLGPSSHLPDRDNLAPLRFVLAAFHPFIGRFRDKIPVFEDAA